MFKSSPVIVRIKDKGDSLRLTVPVHLSRKLNLKDGEEIIAYFNDKVMLLGERKERIERLENLRGVFKDVDIEGPINELRKRWETWKLPKFA